MASAVEAGSPSYLIDAAKALRADVDASGERTPVDVYWSYCTEDPRAKSAAFNEICAYDVALCTQLDTALVARGWRTNLLHHREPAPAPPTLAAATRRASSRPRGNKPMFAPSGIDAAKVVVVCLSRAYCLRLQRGDLKDRLVQEFLYALHHRPHGIIPLVLEACAPARGPPLCVISPSRLACALLCLPHV